MILRELLVTAVDDDDVKFPFWIEYFTLNLRTGMMRGLVWMKWKVFRWLLKRVQQIESTPTPTPDQIHECVWKHLLNRHETTTQLHTSDFTETTRNQTLVYGITQSTADVTLTQSIRDTMRWQECTPKSKQYDKVYDYSCTLNTQSKLCHLLNRTAIISTRLLTLSP